MPGPRHRQTFHLGPFFRFADDAEFSGLLEGCGLTEVEISAIAYTHSASTIDEIWDGLLSGTVRTSAMIFPLPAAIQREVPAAFDRRLAPYWSDGHVILPIAVKLARGRQPA